MSGRKLRTEAGAQRGISVCPIFEEIGVGKLKLVSPLVMLWTAPPPASRCVKFRLLSLNRQCRHLAQSVSSARGICRSANRRIADCRPRASGYRSMADLTPSHCECVLLTQSGPSARVLSGAWAMSQASRKLGENHRPHPPRHPTPRKVLSCLIEFRVSLSGNGLNPSTRKASAASSETIVENLSCYAATTDAPCGSPAVVSRSISSRVTSGSR